MKFLHLADLHIGKHVNGFPLIDDQRFTLEHVVQTAKAEKVDALVLAGDIYDKSMPSEDAVRLLDWFLSEITAAGIPCLGIPGNHDSANRLAFAQALLAKQGVYLPAEFDGRVSSVKLEDEYGPVTFWLLPFIRPIDTKRAYPEANVGASYTEAVKAVLATCDVDTTERNVILAHQFATCGSSSPERADEEINLGGLDNVDVSAFEAFDYVALGHVHRPQRIGRDTARYAGSLLKYSFSETNYRKSLPLVKLGPKGAEDSVGDCVSFTLLPLTPLHDMREIKGPLEKLLSKDVIAAADPQDYIHAILTDETPHIDALSRLRADYPNIMLLDYENSLTRKGSASIQAIDPDNIEPKEAFATFFQQQSGHELSEEQAALIEKTLNEALETDKGATR